MKSPVDTKRLQHKEHPSLKPVYDGEIVPDYKPRSSQCHDYRKRIDKIEAKKELKEDYELKIAEFQAKNPRLPYFISIFGLIISFMAFINSCNSDKQKTKHNQQIQETQKEAPILRDTDSVIYTNPL